MDKKFTVKLTEDEYLDFLLLQVIRGNNFKGLKLFLRIGIPALLVSLIFIFKIKNIFLIILISLLALIWIIYLSNIIFIKIIRGSLKNKIIKENLKEIETVEYRFTDKFIYVNNEKVRYENTSPIYFTNSSFLIYYKKKDNVIAILLPYRLFDSDEEKKSFIKDFEKNQIK